MILSSIHERHPAYAMKINRTNHIRFFYLYASYGSDGAKIAWRLFYIFAMLRMCVLNKTLFPDDLDGIDAEDVYFRNWMVNSSFC